MQGKFFPYHWGATWPLTALLAALGFFKVYRRAVARGRLMVTALFAGVVVVGTFRSATEPRSFLGRTINRVSLLATGDHVAWDRLATVKDSDADANRTVAAWTRERVATDQPIYVWGFEPVIYDLADRQPSTRYIYNVAQRVTWGRVEARAVLMRELAERPPAAIIVEHGDVFQWVTGDKNDSAMCLHAFPELSRLLAERYATPTRVDRFEVYLAH
jgi:hypothetical protein